MRASIESLRASVGQITLIPMSHVSVLPEDEIHDDDPAETQVHEETRNPAHEEEEDEDN